MSVIIDSHQHFWKYDPEQYAWIDDVMRRIQRDFLPEDLEPLLDAHHVYGTIAVQADQSEAETEFLLRLARKHEFIKGVIGWVDLTADNVADRLAFFADHPKFKGVRHTVWDEGGEFLLAPDFQRGISKLATHNLVFELLVFDYQLKSAVKLVSRFPDQAFVLNHFGKPNLSAPPNESWKENIYALSRNPNVHCKVSGVYSAVNHQIEPLILHQYLDFLFKSFGDDRLLFGSDWPMCLLSADYAKTIEILRNQLSGLSSGEFARLMGENAAVVYGL